MNTAEYDCTKYISTISYGFLGERRNKDPTISAIIVVYHKVALLDDFGLLKYSKLFGLKYLVSQSYFKDPNKTIQIVVINTKGPWCKENEISSCLLLY